MVAQTTNQGLRYPQLADAPCDGDLHLGYLAQDTEAKIESHAFDLERVARPARLIARLTLPTLEVYESGFSEHPIVFDSVESQAGGSFFLDAAGPAELNFPQTGFWRAGIEVYFEPTGTSNSYDFGVTFRKESYQNVIESGNELGLQIYSRDGNTSQEVDLDSSTMWSPGEYLTTSGLVRVASIDDNYQWYTGMKHTGGGVAVQTLAARMYLYWVGDL